VSFRFPVTLDLSDQRCLVIGGGPMAAQRAEALLDADAHVVIVTDKPGEEVQTLVHGGRAGLLSRLATSEDLEGARLVFATLEDDADIPTLFKHADANGILFSATDDVEHCHFAMPAIVSRGDLVVTISTSGRAPALSKRLRAAMEQTISDELGRLVDVLAEARERLLPRSIPFAEWSARWSRALEPLDDLTARIAAGDEDGVLQRIVSAVRGSDNETADTDLEDVGTDDDSQARGTAT
jgi:siroheme synthase-like protein